MNPSRRPIVILSLALLLLPLAASAEELLNDGWTSGGSLAFQGGFASGEIDAARNFIYSGAVWAGVGAVVPRACVLMDDVAHA